MMDKKNAGKRIRLDFTRDEFTALRAGDMGTVKYERDDGFSNVIAVDWDSGSSLSLVESEDIYTILD